MFAGQWERLRGMDVESIPHGVRFPHGFIQRVIGNNSPLFPDDKDRVLCEKGTALNFGSGGNLTVIEGLKSLGYDPINFDINLSALLIEQERFKKFLPSFVANVGEWGLGWELVASSLIESSSLVYMGALLENMGTDWPSAIENATISLVPSGSIIIGGVADQRHINPLMEKELGVTSYLDYRKAWQKRLHAAMMLNPKVYTGTNFPVLKPGDTKEKEWSRPEVLGPLVLGSTYERDAQHMDLNEILLAAKRLGLKFTGFEWRVWRSRENKPLSGFVMALQKGETYQFCPGAVGMTREEIIKTRIRVDGPPRDQESRRTYFLWKAKVFEEQCRNWGIEPRKTIIRMWEMFAEGDYSLVDATENIVRNY